VSAQVDLTPSTFDPGDFNFDGEVDGDAFLKWQRDPSVGSLANWEANYGSVALLAAATTAVPEPTTLAMALVAFAGLLLKSNRRALV